MIVEIEKDELWYGPSVQDGRLYPYDESTCETVDVENATCSNAVNPLMLSSNGRYIWCEKGFIARISSGKIDISSSRGEIILREGFGSLRGAYKDACTNFFPPDGKMPPEVFFSSPQFNDWIEIMYDQTEEKILNYAHGIVDAGFTPGVLMIDDMWARGYGSWKFNEKKIPHPKEMIDGLHSLGFKVILWVCSYIFADTEEYEILRRQGGLVRDPETGEPAVIQWWNGRSPALDLTNPVDRKLFGDELDALMHDYGVDGFKFDGGSADSYKNTVSASGANALELSQAWAEFGKRYEYNEVRSAYRCAGGAGVWRLSDKSHSWTENGLAEVIPNTLSQSSLGYAFSCPDMVGGGIWLDFLPGAKDFDPELFLRYCAASALLPMIQFSAAPWRVLSDEDFGHVKSLMEQRARYTDLIVGLARASSVTGEPIVRRMEYVFPHEGLGRINDQFMLGDDILVAPCMEKGKRERKVSLPRGSWQAEDGTLYKGGTDVIIPAPLNRVPLLKKVG